MFAGQDLLLAGECFVAIVFFVFANRFSRWVSAFGFCCWAFGGRLRFLSAAKICQELLGAAIARMRLGDGGESGRGSVC